ncbi:MAG: agmatinase [Ferrimicrobium sp.]
MNPIGPTDSLKHPRYANIGTFARLPTLASLDHNAAIAILGAPFDSGVSYRPGARFGPHGIRAGSQLLRPWDPALSMAPFGEVQVADAGDLAINPFSIETAITEIEAGANELLTYVKRLLVLGGDHTIALPLLRSVVARHGPVALVHFDAHLDTWDTYFDAPYTHGTPFRRAFEEGLLIENRSIHVGTRGPLYSATDLSDDHRFGFAIHTADDLAETSAAETAQRIVDLVGDSPVYLSLDIDVLDPAYAPGTGTPEAGGPSSGEILRVLRGLAGCHIIGCDVVEVSPVYDHAEVTAIAASHIGYTMIGLMAIDLRS